MIWCWPLTKGEQSAPVVVQTATGRTADIARDGLAGYQLEHWIVPRTFRIGRIRFVTHGPFVFSRPKQHPGWLIARVLDQLRRATFRGGRQEVLTFEQAYPGEQAIYEFAIDVYQDDSQGLTEARP